MSLFILLGECEPWLYGAVICTFTLFIVSLVIWRRGKLGKNTKTEEQIDSLPPKINPPLQIHFEEEEHHSVSSESETEPVTLYCSNGCQGACACPALESDLEYLTKNNTTLMPLVPDMPSSPYIPPPKLVLEVSKPDYGSYLRRRSADKSKLSFQYFKDKFHGESFDAGSKFDVSGRRGSERRGSEGTTKERKRSRFAEWRRRSTKQENKTKQGSSSEVSQAGSKHRSDSLKVLRGMLSFRKASVEVHPQMT